MGSNGFKLPLGWNCKKLVDCTKEGNISYGIVQPGQHQEDGGNDSNLLIVFYVQIMPDDFVMQLHRF